MTLFEHGIGLGYFNTDAFEEIQFTTSGITAEHSKGGLILNTVVRDGGNAFNGGARFYYEGPGLQGDNVDQELRDKGVFSTGGNLDHLYSLSLDLGGPIVKDRLWFYNAFREYRSVPFVVNCVLPSGEQCTDGSFLTNYTMKLTTRVDDYSQLMLNGEWARKQRPNRGVSQFTAPEAAFFQDGRHFIVQGKYNRTIGSDAFLDIYAGWGSPPFPLDYQDGVGNATSRYDVVRFTRQDAASLEFFSLAHQWTFGTNYTLFRDDWLGTSHDLKFGVEHRRGTYYTRRSHNSSLERRYSDGVPFRVRVFNSPTEINNNQEVWSAYVQDDVRVDDVTLNLGVRLESHTANIPEQRPNNGRWVGPIFPTQPVDPIDSVASWTTVSPRLGFAWDINGDGRTVAKANYGRYYFGIDNVDIHNYAIPTASSTAEFAWDDLNGNDSPDYPDEFGTRIFQTGVTPRTLADGFESPRSDEISASIERALSRRSSIQLQYTYRKNSNLWGATWANLPPSAYDVPTTAVDPISGNTIEYWSINPAFVGIDRGETLANHSDNFNRYHGVDLIYARRYDGTWMLTASATVSDNFGRVGGYTDRNAREIFGEGAYGLDQPFAFKVSGMYDLPWDINFGLAFRHGSGMNVYGGSNLMAREVRVQDATTGLLLLGARGDKRRVPPAA